MTVEVFGIESSFQGSGLNESEVHARRQQYGYNEIPEKRVGPLTGTLKRMWGPIPWLLEAAMVFEFFLGKITQAIVVFLLLVFSALVGEIQELRAKKALGFLHQKLQLYTRTLRNGTWLSLPSRELVPGDIVHVRIGDIAAADLEIVGGSLSVDESSLTGESVDVNKAENDTVFSSSTITHGEAIARVSATGKKSSYGKTAELVRTAEAPGRLQTLLFTIVRYLAYLDVVLAVVLIGTALINGTPWHELLPFTIILFIATIPISMPSSFVVANSVEAKNLAKERVLVTGLTGIQEAASMNVLLVDKTGTLTNNRPEIAGLVPFDTLEDKAVLQLAASASDHTSNDTISTAIVEACRVRKLEMLERVSFTPFDPVHKISRARIKQDGVILDIVMGSPQVIAEISETPNDFFKQVEILSANGARILALASGENESLACHGLLALADSPRSDARDSIAKIQRKGIRVIMLTGDTISTARAIAREVGIGDRIGTLKDALTNPLDFDGFANVFPEDKYRIVKKLQEMGMVVGMTGDGINDAPALKQADVGIAVSSATDVAKSAARIVLTEARLSDIAKVIDSGHRVYRRMMTWTITKLARTAELAALLTFGFIFTGFFPVSLSLIVFIIVMNDMVTLTLGTDKAWPTQVPEQWNLPRLAKISAIFTVGWLVLGLGLLWFYHSAQNLGSEQISSLMFLYLMYSAMATIIMTRTRYRFWSFAPSTLVGGMISANLILATLMAAQGWVMAMVPLQQIMILAAITISAMLVLDSLKLWYYDKTGILG